MDALLGKSNKGREELIIEAESRTALRKGSWAMIPPSLGTWIENPLNIELGFSHEFQLYNLDKDIGQQDNLAKREPEMLKKLNDDFEKIRWVDSN